MRKNLLIILLAVVTLLTLIACGDGPDEDENGPAVTSPLPSSPEIEQLENQVAASPDKDELLGDLAAAYNEVGRHDDAIAYYQQALIADPGDYEWREALQKLGGDFAPVIAALKQKIAADPGNDENHGGLGQLLVLIGRQEEGIPYLMTALRLDPADLEWTDILIENGGDPAAVVEILDSAVSQHQDDDEFWGSLAKARHAAGDTAGARAALGHAQQLDPEDSEWESLADAWAAE